MLLYNREIADSPLKTLNLFSHVSEQAALGHKRAVRKERA